MLHGRNDENILYEKESFFPIGKEFICFVIKEFYALSCLFILTYGWVTLAVLNENLLGSSQPLGDWVKALVCFGAAYMA